MRENKGKYGIIRRFIDGHMLGQKEEDLDDLADVSEEEYEDIIRLREEMESKIIAVETNGSEVDKYDIEDGLEDLIHEREELERPRTFKTGLLISLPFILMLFPALVVPMLTSSILLLVLSMVAGAGIGSGIVVGDVNKRVKRLKEIKKDIKSLEMDRLHILEDTYTLKLTPEEVDKKLSAVKHVYKKRTNNNTEESQSNPRQQTDSSNLNV